MAGAGRAGAPRSGPRRPGGPAPGASAAAASPARVCAFAVVRRVFEQGAYADRALHHEAAGLDPRERGLATALAYGAVQRRLTLDHIAGGLCSRPLASLDPPVLAGLRLGLLQLLFLDGIADHAAVHETVELVKRASHGGAGLVNAVLRRATREGPAMLAALDDSTPEHAAVCHSVPEWLARLWWDELGAEEAVALLRQVNEPAESALRVNTLVSSVEEVLAALPVGAAAAPDLAEGLVLKGAYDAHGSDLFARGAIMPQSRASMLVSRELDPQSGEPVLDMCAAPGAKTTHLAALMSDEGSITAVERNPGRARSLAATCARLHAGCVSVHVADAARFDGARGCARVLVDPPCSGLGTLQSRPDLRWRVTEESIAQLPSVQSRILAAGAAATAPGGALVYSVCTISRAESAGVVDGFLSTHHEFELAGEPRQLLPHRDGTDGFFIARLRRRHG